MDVSAVLASHGFIAIILDPVILVLWFILTFLPELAVAVRRLHDQDQSGWLVLIGLIPFIGPIAFIVFMCLEGTQGPNRFGPDPKGEEVADRIGLR